MDEALIKLNYSRLTEAQLQHLAETEGPDLTGEALSILHEEFLNRGMDTAVFGIVEDGKTARQRRQLEKLQEIASNDFYSLLWNYALEQKGLGTPDLEIRKGLLDQGLNEEHATIMVKLLEAKTREKLNECSAAMIKGFLFFAAGLLVTYWTYSSAPTGGVYVVAWGAVIYGVIWFLRGATRQEKFKRILHNLQMQKDSGEKVD